MQVSLPLTICTLAARLAALTFILAFQVKLEQLADPDYENDCTAAFSEYFYGSFGIV